MGESFGLGIQPVHNMSRPWRNDCVRTDKGHLLDLIGILKPNFADEGIHHWPGKKAITEPQYGMYVMKVKRKCFSSDQTTRT